MTEQIKFPTDWTQMSEEGVAENIKYLTKNRKKHDVRVINESSAQIDNVRIVFYTIEQHGHMVKVAKINNRNVRSDQNCNLYSAVENLYNTCKQDNIRKYERSEIRKNNASANIVGTLVVALIMGLSFAGAKAGLERQEKEKQEKIEWARKLLQDYEQERNKTAAVNVDSLINQHIR